MAFHQPGYPGWCICSFYDADRAFGNGFNSSEDVFGIQGTVLVLNGVVKRVFVDLVRADGMGRYT